MSTRGGLKHRREADKRAERSREEAEKKLAKKTGCRSQALKKITTGGGYSRDTNVG